MRFDSIAADIGWRYAFSRHSSLALIGNIAICGLALSIAVLVIVVSVINGFERELERRVFGVLPHLSVLGRTTFVPGVGETELLGSLPAVQAAAPFVQAVGLATGAGKVQGVLLTGIDPAGYSGVSDLAGYLEPGAANDESRPGAAAPGAAAKDPASGAEGALANVLRPRAYGAILGTRLAARLGVGVGDKVTLVLPTATITLAGAFPRQKRFEVTGLLRSESELDTRAAFVHLQDGQRLMRLGDRVQGYQLKLHDFFDAPGAARESLALLGRDRFVARTWMRTHGNLYRAIGTQKTMMFVLLAFLVGVAAFNLVSTLVMAVEQRGPDMAILKTMGADTRSVTGSFVLLGALIGGVGTAAGIAVGTAVAAVLPAVFGWISDTLALDLMNQYFINYLPVDIRLTDVAAIAGTAFGLCVISTVYPAWRAALLLPREVLAHE